MERTAVVRMVCALWACSSALLTGAAAAQAEDVVVFAVADGPASSERIAPLVADVRARLVLDKRAEVRPAIRPAANVVEPSLGEARAIGRSAFNQLAEGRAADNVLSEYEPQIVGALGAVSAVADAEGRELLWNLCALRVHLLLLVSSERREANIREAVMDCSRRFIDRPQLGKAWLQEVVRTFEEVTSQVRAVPLTIKSAPANCEVRIYGALVGTTPAIVDVMPGTHEVQLDCAGRKSALHAVDVSGPRDLVIRLDGDAAYSEVGRVPWLRYASAGGAERALDDAATFAQEVRADSFVLIYPTDGAEAVVRWLRTPSTLLGEGEVVLTADRSEQAEQISLVFGSLERADDTTGGSRVKPRRVWQDYALGGSLAIAGGALSIYPLIAMTRDGQCQDSNCTAVYKGKSWEGGLMLAGAGALVASGIAVTWWGPFGRRMAVQIGTGVSVRGSF